MLTVYKREFKSLMTSIYGFLCAAVLLCAVGITMYQVNLQAGLADMSYNTMQLGEFALILTIPLLCMQSVTYDKKHGIDRLYAALPLRTHAVILGKFLAILTVFTLPMVILALYPLLMNAFGDVNFSSAYASLLVFYLLGAALIALSMFISTLTKYMTIAAVSGIAVGVILYFLPHLAVLLPLSPLFSFIGFGLLALLLTVGAWFITKSPLTTAVTAAVTVLPLTVLYILDVFVFHWNAFEGLFPLILTLISPFYQFQRVVINGTFDLFSVTVLLVMAVYFLFLTVKSADRRRMA